MDVLKVGVKQTQLIKSHAKDFVFAIQLGVIWEYVWIHNGLIKTRDEIPAQLSSVGVMTIPLG